MDHADAGELLEPCRTPHLAPLSGYRYGCRCPRCSGGQAEALERYKRRARGEEPDLCKKPGCTEPRRRVQGARFCDDHSTRRKSDEVSVCASCGETTPPDRRRRYELCAGCRRQASRLLHHASAHHVPHPRLIQWLQHPACDICHRGLSLGKATAGEGFAIDRDDRCCDGGPPSCGRCVRGLLCVGCKTAVDALRAMVARSSLEAVRDYEAQ